jgi:hypothetical protein
LSTAGVAASAAAVTDAPADDRRSFRGCSCRDGERCEQAENEKYLAHELLLSLSLRTTVESKDADVCAGFVPIA